MRIKIFTLLVMVLMLCPSAVQKVKAEVMEVDICSLDYVICEGEIVEPLLTFKTIKAYVTGYTTTIGETDSSPCVSASGENICGLSDAAACPRWIPFNTIITIERSDYRCLDRLSLKYDDRFDISFQKDVKAAREFGIQFKEVKVWGL